MVSADESGSTERKRKHDSIELSESEDHFFDNVAFGSFQSINIFSHIVVISQSWPSWVYSLGGIFNGARIFVTVENDLNFKRIWFDKSIIWWNWTDWKTSIRELELKNLFVGIQGHYEFVSRVLVELKDYANNASCVAAVLCDDVNAKLCWGNISLCDRFVSHASCGGVTRDKWRIVAAHHGEDLVKAKRGDESTQFGSTIKRTLTHIIDTTQMGRRSLKDDVDVPVFMLGDIIPVRWIMKCWLKVPSVFCVGKLVYRHFTKREILNMKDVPVEMEKSMGRHVPPLILQAIILSTPAKILWETLRYFFTSEPSSFSLKGPTLKTDDMEDITKSFKSLLSQTVALAPNTEDDMIETTPEGITLKAVKPDDAEAEDRIWNQRLFHVCELGKYNHEIHAPLMNLFRERAIMKWYYRNIYKSFRSYLNNEYGEDFVHQHLQVIKFRKSSKRKRSSEKLTQFKQDLVAGREILFRCCNSSFWEWKKGSRLIFWRWPKEFRREARDGSEVYIKDKLPNYTKKQNWTKIHSEKKAMIKKLHKVQERGYVIPGHVSSLTGFFCVPKGSDDIRMVYDATKCGLNDSVWAPNFAMPTVDSSLRAMEVTTWCGDIDLGEMFLNYMMDEKIRPYCGIDVTECLRETDAHGFRRRSKGKRVWYRWERCMMGFRSSPYNAVKACTWSEEIIRGNNMDESSPFHWDVVVLNLPGMKTYNPILPWVYKWNTKLECIAGEIFIYVDDIRPTGKDDSHCERVCHRTASRSNYLGQQDAPRKRRPPSQQPGLWSGSLVKTNNSNIFISTSQEKWNKGRAIIFNLISHYTNNVSSKTSCEPTFDFKNLERGRGFLVHLGNTYPWIRPRLKGIHHTLDSWRGRRDTDGWKYSDKDWDFLCDDARRNKDDDALPFLVPKLSHGGKVIAVKRLKWDLLALGKLMSGMEPPLRLIRGKKLYIVKYGFGDASGSGFGSSWEDSNGGVSYRFGTWGSDGSSKSSNYRELRNLVDTLEDLSVNEDLSGMEMFLFTDNSVAENAFYKGSSSSPLLFQLILRLNVLEKDARMKLHLIHVAGTRMISQGADGLSRGNMMEGVMSGRSMLNFVPIHKSALEVQHKLEKWIRSWLIDGEAAEVLSPSDWFVRGHDIGGYALNDDGIDVPIYKSGTFIWSPPAAAADVAMQELRKARHKRQNSLHVFVCPRLMKFLWFKQAFKAADIVFDVKPEFSFWDQNCHEPLIILVLFPFLRVHPWQLRRTPPILEVEGLLRQVQEGGEKSFRSILWQLCLFTRRLQTMSSGMVRQMLYSGSKFSISCSESRE